MGDDDNIVVVVDSPPQRGVEVGGGFKVWTLEVGAEQGEKKGRASLHVTTLDLVRFMISMPVSLLPVHGLIHYSVCMPMTPL